MKKFKTKFASAEELNKLITHYFKWIEGEYHTEQKEIKGNLKDVKVYDREPEHPTIAGLAFHLGFCSLKQMEQRETKGKYSELLQCARLRIMAAYEKRLLDGPSSAVIFALKGLGWNDREDNKPAEATNVNLKTEFITTGPPLASSERNIAL